MPFNSEDRCKPSQLADEIGISVRTVEAHRARLVRKVGAKNGGELVAWFPNLPSHTID